MLGTGPETKLFSEADGRSTETEQRSHCPADCSKQQVWQLKTPAVDSLTDGTSRYSNLNS